jgi:hypothetical protein
LVIGIAFAEPLFLQNSVMHSEHDSVAAQEPTLSAPTSIHRRAVARGGFLLHQGNEHAESRTLLAHVLPSSPIRGGVVGLQRKML